MTKFFITLTGPSTSGKNHLLNYIREEKYPCLVSTTTRSPRLGEINGKDYYFISDEESKSIEENDGFSEFTEYRGIRYGVTKEEFNHKMQQYGYAFLIVEPSGIENYKKTLEEIGAEHFSYYIHTPMEVLQARIKNRTNDAIEGAFRNHIIHNDKDKAVNYSQLLDDIEDIVTVNFDRVIALTTTESKWYEQAIWTRTLMGLDDPKKNLSIILKDIEDRKAYLQSFIET
jgi:guanylate kinase